MSVQIHAGCFLYDLRLIRTLLAEHNEQLWSTQATRRCHQIVTEMIGVIEDESLYQAAQRASQEARVGSVPLQSGPERPGPGQ